MLNLNFLLCMDQSVYLTYVEQDRTPSRHRAGLSRENWERQRRYLDSPVPVHSEDRTQEAGLIL